MAPATHPTSARTSAGTLTGHVTDHGIAFRGVRYASADRFEAPRPVEAWSEPVTADTVGLAAPQLVTTDAVIPDMAVGDIGEDCLQAEIWTPAVDGSRPVLVWIPGGRYQIGGAGLATYDGARLSAEGDLVVIGLNYRLGAFGFLAAEGVPSNLGLRDLVAALEWIRAEVAAFGGDPANITLMGESAGAGAIAHLLACPAARGLFHGAIVASGAPGATLDNSAAESVTAALLAAAGVDSIDDLRTIDLSRLLAAQGEADAALLATVGMMPFHPWVDGDLLPVAPMAAELAEVPVIFGTTAQEMALFRDQIPELPEEFAIGWLATKCAAFASDPAAAAAAGLAACEGDIAEAIADTDLHVPAGLLADRHVARDLPVWRYSFTWQSPELGAAHATDLPFHFGSLDVADWRTTVGAVDERSAAADALSAAMRQAWAAFCHTKEPACDPVGTWPRHGATSRRAVELGDIVTVSDDVGGPRFRAWTEN